jgi:hypothetical protein
MIPRSGKEQAGLSRTVRVSHKAWNFVFMFLFVAFQEP